MCTEEHEFLDLVDFEEVAFSVKSVILLQEYNKEKKNEMTRTF